MQPHAWHRKHRLRPGVASLIRMGIFFTPHRIYIIGKEVTTRTIPTNCAFFMPSFRFPLHTLNLRQKWIDLNFLKLIIIIAMENVSAAFLGDLREEGVLLCGEGPWEVPHITRCTVKQQPPPSHPTSPSGLQSISLFGLSILQNFFSTKINALKCHLLQ